MKAAPLALASLLWLCACPTSAGPDGGRSTSGGSDGGSAFDAGPCPSGSGCTRSDGGAGICAGACVDTTSDPFDCGAADLDCPSGAACVGGTCTLTACAGASSSFACTFPDAGGQGICCAGACLNPQVDFFDDPQNCGDCGAACERGAECVEGLCTLADGGPGDCSVDGDCPSGQVCTADGCQPASCSGATDGVVCALPDGGADPSGLCCSGACVDPLWDNASCGGCGLACESFHECLGGSCVPLVECGDPALGFLGAPCNTSTGSLNAGPGICCGPLCADTDTDSANCGGCGQVCPTGSRCKAGGCTFPDGGGASCGTPAVGCPSGTLCAANGCVASSCGGDGGFCFLGIQSGAGLCCGGACVDPTQDPGSCGGCGVDCGSGLCVGGLCLPSGTSCAGAGGCPSGEACVGGQCQQTDCADETTDLCAFGGNVPGVCCVGVDGEGDTTVACVDPATNPANCGGCSFACPSGQSCAGGLCSGTVAPCDETGRIGDGCALGSTPDGLCCPGGGCSDVASDAQNCGYCGNACANGQTCINGRCG